MRWLRRWWGGYVDREPIPLIVWDARLDDPPTEDTSPLVRRLDASDDTDPSVVVGVSVEPQRPFDPPVPVRPRVKPVVVRVTLAEWRALVREANSGQDLGDVLRRWAGLPPLNR